MRPGSCREKLAYMSGSVMREEAAAWSAKGKSDVVKLQDGGKK